MRRASTPTAGPSPSATRSAAPAQNSPPPSSANSSARTPATAWSPCASAEAWARPASSSASEIFQCSGRSLDRRGLFFFWAGFFRQGVFLFWGGVFGPSLFRGGLAPPCGAHLRRFFFGSAVLCCFAL